MCKLSLILSLIRFLTRLTDHQICLMNEEDLREFSFSVNAKQKGVSVGSGLKVRKLLKYAVLVTGFQPFTVLLFRKRYQNWPNVTETHQKLSS